MEIFIIRLLQFVLALSILILLHEGGHFFFARLFGIRVEKFYLFFDPWFHLFQYKPKNSDTTYGVGWLPLGGYCKISGMIDESLDTEQMKQPAQPWEFRSKPAWQRLLVMLGGVLVNFFLALFIYSMVLFHWGDNYIAVKDMRQGMKFNKMAKTYGFKDGDILLGTDQGEFKDFNADLFRSLSTAHRADLIRDEKKISIPLPGDINLLAMIKDTPKFAMPLLPNTVDSVIPEMAAAKAGIRQGDTITAINGICIDSYNDFTYETGRIKDMLTAAQSPQDSVQARTVLITYKHAGDTVAQSTQAVLDDQARIGLIFTNILDKYPQTRVEYGFLQSFPAGCRYGLNVLGGYIDDLKYVFTSEGAKSIGGFAAIGSLFPPVWDWHIFWLMTAFLSIILAFMNILPIPALDGGHVLFLLYEMITGKKPGEKFMLRAEYAGIIILILLMVVANLNDVLRFLGYLH